MNVTEFAEQIVFGTTLEEKLAAPGDLDFSEVTEMSTVVHSITAPGRPVELAMQSIAGKNVKPPRDENLGNDLARGQLLHFLANHELLATELMAYVWPVFLFAGANMLISGYLTAIHHPFKSGLMSRARAWCRTGRPCGRNPLS